jgi:hypothetical protein
MLAAVLAVENAPVEMDFYSFLIDAPDLMLPLPGQQWKQLGRTSAIVDDNARGRLLDPTAPILGAPGE